MITLSAEREETADVCDRLPLDDWVDPTGDRPVWSAPDFRRAAVVAAPQRSSMLVLRRGGRPVLAAPLIAAERPGGLLFYDVPAMIGDERAFGGSLRPTPTPTEARTAAYPSLAVASHGAYHGILVDPGLDAADRDQVCAALPDLLAAVASEGDYASHAVLYATAALTRLLYRAGMHRVAVLGAESVLDTGAAHWDAYVAELSSRRRGRVTHERREFLAGPIVTEVTEGPDSLGPDLVDLRVGLRERHGLPGRREDTLAEFAALARWCPSRLVTIRARLDGDVVGFTVFLRDGHRLYARTAGFDHDRLRPRDYCYFNVTYYAALDWALPRGVRRLEYGFAAYPAKRTRGCRFLPRFGVFALPTGDVALADALREQDRTERLRLERECGAALIRPADWEEPTWT